MTNTNSHSKMKKSRFAFMPSNDPSSFLNANWYKIFKVSAYWLMFLLYYTVVILVLGTVSGAVLFAFLGPLFVDSTFLVLIKKGAWIGFRYAGVWAGGTAIVLCFIKGARKRGS